jgi:chromate transporter
MRKNKRFYLKLFTSTFYISAFTFGGGYVIIPLMRKKFVEQYKWIDGKEMIDLVAIAQSTPGAIAVNAALLIGYRLAGMIGAIITILGTILPPFITISLISLAYSTFRDSIIVQYILRGMQAGVAAVILDVVINMVFELLRERKVLPVLVMVCAFIATYFFHINVMLVIILSSIIGAIGLRKVVI